MLNRRILAKFRSLLVATALFAGLTVLFAGTAGPAFSGSGTLNVAITPGNPIVIAVTAPSMTVSNTRPNAACVAVLVRTSIHGWSLAASYTAESPAALNVVLERPAAGDDCGAPAIGGTTSRLRSGDTATLLANQNGSQMVTYVLMVRPSVPLSAPVTLTLTFAADAPGAPVARSFLTVGLDKSGRLSPLVADHKTSTNSLSPAP